ncbi:unnamed protein product [Cylindrotheca closterium]|uniref:Actin n=1 Tax=Cylindrotheca closterium TaxID=2856 RepID=A0AAD2G6Q2_9STRA|nr:unnamed protein product [Cylindrotheca closterium]
MAGRGEKNVAIVIDTGSGRTKAGFSDDEAPRTTFASLVAHPTTNWGPNAKKVVGQPAEGKWGVLDVKQPIERGIVTNWDDIETLWHHTFYRELKTTPEFYPVFLTEVPMNPKANRERITEMMFETFKVPALYMNTTAALSLYAHGRTTGCVLECGEGVTHVVPVYEGVVLVNAIVRLDVGGKVLTDYLEKMISDHGYTLQDHEMRNVTGKGLSLTTEVVHLQVRGIMEKLCYVALDFNKESIKVVEDSHNLEKKHTLSNGDTVVIGNERFFLPEALFQPELADLEEESVVDATFGAIMKCDEYMHEEMLSNIVLSGGCTKFPGFKERLTKEMAALAPNTLEVNVLAMAEPQNTPWVGASVVASLDEFQNMWISKEEFYKKGPSIVHSKCF